MSPKIYKYLQLILLTKKKFILTVYNYDTEVNFSEIIKIHGIGI